MHTHKLEIQGKIYSVRSDAPVDYMQRVAQLVDASMSEAREAGAGPQQTAVLAALNLAGEIVDLGERFDEWKSAIRDNLGEIAGMVDRALDEAASSRRT